MQGFACARCRRLWFDVLHVSIRILIHFAFEAFDAFDALDTVEARDAVGGSVSEGNDSDRIS